MFFEHEHVLDALVIALCEQREMNGKTIESIIERMTME
jgi:hypothetical protein